MRPEVRLHIRDNGASSALAIGPGKVALLEAIRDEGSITSAAKSLGMSYRRAWMLVDETNRCLSSPAVETVSGGEKGGGAVLTPEGARLVTRYRSLEKKTQDAVDRALGTLLRSTAAKKARPAPAAGRKK